MTDDLLTTTRDDLRAWDVPQRLPLVILRSTQVFPFGVAAVQVTSGTNVAAIRALSSTQKVVVIVRADSTAAPPATFVGKIGVAAGVLDRMNLADEAVQVTFQGKRRVRIDGVATDEAWPVADVSPVLEPEETRPELDRRIGAVLRLAETLASLDPAVNAESVETLRANVEDASHFADLVAQQLPFTVLQRDRIVAEPAPAVRLDMLCDFLAAMVERAEVQREVDRLTTLHVERGRREYLLRQQLEAIRAELGEDDALREARELRARVESLPMPETAKAEALRELDRLGRLTPASAEYQVARTYLDWMLGLPWGVEVEERHPDPQAVRAVLDLGHLALDEAKKRIVEYLAVRRLAPQARPPILCFVGPPGVGKTSLGRAIADAMGRPFGRMSLGGVDDEAVIRGHRRTYVGAMPGKIVQEISRARAMNPVLMIDEIDKLGADRPGHGSPSAALLEVLDPEQNVAFVDHYLNVPFDLSRVLFIATANAEPQIPEPLLDRMEVIEIPGYTPEEKVAIARRHLLPQLLPEHGFADAEISIGDEALGLLASGYAREAGVRGIKRDLAALLRHVAAHKAGGAAGPWALDAKLIDEVLGQPRFVDERAQQVPAVGVANGLAWTATGGDLLPVEAIAMQGTGQFQVTGQLGSVMIESVQAAASWVRSRAEDLGIRRSLFGQRDVHVHFPEGAIPKDGPSAGVTIAAVLASLFTQRPIRSDVAMTGEITLTGRVLAIGGLREKLGAAVRGLIPTAIIPAANEPDLRDVPDSIKRALKIHLVETADEVLRLALLPKPRAAHPAPKPRALAPRAARGGGPHRPRNRR
jgi:ATP-dependent Lon protease